MNVFYWPEDAIINHKKVWENINWVAHIFVCLFDWKLKGRGEEGSRAVSFSEELPNIGSFLLNVGLCDGY